MKRKYSIKKHSIYILSIPPKNIPFGLGVIFKPSKNWLKQNKTLEPIMRADINKGQQEYDLPKRFRKKSILEVRIYNKKPA